MKNSQFWTILFFISIIICQTDKTVSVADNMLLGFSLMLAIVYTIKEYFEVK